MDHHRVLLLKRTRIQFPAPMSNGFQLPVTSVLEDLMSLAFKALKLFAHTHKKKTPHIYFQRFTVNGNFLKSRILKLYFPMVGIFFVCHTCQLNQSQMNPILLYLLIKKTFML